MSEECKKVLLVFVEGRSEKTALEHLFEDCFGQEYRVHVKSLGGDITVKMPDEEQSGDGPYSNPGNIEDHLRMLTLRFMLEYGHHEKEEGGLGPDDFYEIIHIIDTDGVFIDPVYVVEDKKLSKKIVYSTSKMEAKDRNNAIFRNEKKGATVKAIIHLGNLRFNNKVSIPYKVFFMSCNLDHVLYNSINLPNNEKVTKAREIRRKYLGDLRGYLEFLTESDFSLVGYSYEASWEYIQSDLNSLNRYTNIGVYFSG